PTAFSSDTSFSSLSGVIVQLPLTICSPALPMQSTFITKILSDLKIIYFKVDGFPLVTSSSFHRPEIPIFFSEHEYNSRADANSMKKNLILNMLQFIILLFPNTIPSWQDQTWFLLPTFHSIHTYTYYPLS